MIFTDKGAELYYELHGDGENTILMLHGWGGKCESFLPLIRDLSGSARIAAVDFPGHARSPEPKEPWSVTEYTALIYAFIEKILGGRCDIVAHSFGCRVSILLAAQHPECVNRMVLTGAAGIRPAATEDKKKKASAYQRMKKLCDNRVTRGVLGDKTVDGMREKLIQKYGSPDYKALSPNMRMTFNRVIAQDLSGYLKDIHASTLLVWGRDDTETPLWMGQQMEKEIPDAGLVVLEGTGHFAYLDQYPQFLAMTRSFLIEQQH